MVLEENLPDVPHLQGPDRVAPRAAAVEELESELLVLDDGFQHRRLHRDLDVVLIDATGRRARTTCSRAARSASRRAACAGPAASS